MRRYLFLFAASIVCLLCLRSSEGQMAAPVIIQAATPGPAVAVKTEAPAPEIGARGTVQLLQEMEATNAATIKKQEAALVTLDELQKAADELKIFGKRS